MDQNDSPQLSHKARLSTRRLPAGLRQEGLVRLRPSYPILHRKSRDLIVVRSRIQTGWPAIFILAAFLTGIFASWLCISGESPTPFYSHHRIACWAAGGFIVLCILAEFSRLKCPNCRSRAIAHLSSQEIDRWIGQKTVAENSYTLGAFQARNSMQLQAKIRGMNESMTVTKRIIPVTKRRILRNYRCGDCDHLFGQETVEEMQ